MAGTQHWFAGTRRKKRRKGTILSMDCCAGTAENMELYAGSLEAGFSYGKQYRCMVFHACLSDKKINKSLFVSPIIDMEHLIHNMIQWAGVTEERLEIEKVFRRHSGRLCHGNISFMQNRIRFPGGIAKLKFSMEARTIWRNAVLWMHLSTILAVNWKSWIMVSTGSTQKSSLLFCTNGRSRTADSSDCVKGYDRAGYIETFIKSGLCAKEVKV